MHAVDIFGRCLLADKDNSAARSMSSDCVLCIKVYAARSSSRRSGKRLSDFSRKFELGRIEARMQQLIQRLRLDSGHRRLLVNHALIHKVAGDLNRCLRGSLAVSCLQEIELAFLDREFHVLHVTIVLFQIIGQLHKLFVALRKVVRELCNRLRRTNTGNDVLALRVDQVLTENALGSGRGIARKCDACARRIPHISENHRLHIDCRAELVRNIVHSSVRIRSGIVPAAEHRFNGLHQLHLRILREFLPLLLPVQFLVLGNDFLQAFRCQLCVVNSAVLFLDIFKNRVKECLRLSHDDI